MVVAGDRGLCGGYNTTVIRTVEREMARLKAEGKQTRLITVGKKATGYFRFRGFPIDDSFVGFSDEPTYEDARTVAEAVVSPLRSRRVRRRARSATRSSSRPACSACSSSAFVPLETDLVDAAAASDGPTADYEFEPGADEILDRLLPRYAEARLYAALLEGSASFFAAQQRAMKSATDNAEELHHQAQPRDEPGPPGRHHHRDHGDRQRRRGAARRAVR